MGGVSGAQQWAPRPSAWAADTQPASPVNTGDSGWVRTRCERAYLCVPTLRVRAREDVVAEKGVRTRAALTRR